MLAYQRVRVAETSCNMVRCLRASWHCVRASGAQDHVQAARLIWLLRVSQPHDTFILICYYLLTKHFFWPWIHASLIVGLHFSGQPWKTPLLFQ